MLIAWLVSGLGIFFLARTFQVLADIKPDLTAGIYMYSRQGFGKYAGFQIAWGYWLSSAFGDVGFAILLMDTLNYFFPPYFKGGNTRLAIVLGSGVFWLMNWLVLRGVKSASALNVIGTIAKFVSIVVVIGVVAVSMKAGVLVYFSDNAWNVMISITGVVILPAYIGATGFLWKLMAQGQYPATARIGKTSARVSSILGTVYGVWLVYAAGREYMIAGAVFFALGSLLFMWARREHARDEAMFTKIEMAVALTLVVLGALALWMLFSGHLTKVFTPGGLRPAPAARPALRLTRLPRAKAGSNTSSGISEALSTVGVQPVQHLAAYADAPEHRARQFHADDDTPGSLRHAPLSRGYRRSICADPAAAHRCCRTRTTHRNGGD